MQKYDTLFHLPTAYADALFLFLAGASAPEEEELSWDVDEPNTPAGARQPRSPPGLAPVPETEPPQPGTADEQPPATPPAAADVSVTSPDEMVAAPAAGVEEKESPATPTGAAGVSVTSLEEAAAEGGLADESKKDSPVVPASPRGPSDEEGTHSDGSPEGSTGSGWLVVGKGEDYLNLVFGTRLSPRCPYDGSPWKLVTLSLDLMGFKAYNRNWSILKRIANAR